MTKKLTTDEFIQKAKEIHGDKYDYSKTKYITQKEKVEIICPIHGVFSQNPNLHYNKGIGCMLCYKDRQRYTREEFIELANKKHNNLYDYLLVNWRGSKVKVKIICKIHGIFTQLPPSHLQRCGCPLCSSEKIRLAVSLSTEEFIQKAIIIHNNRYNYSKTVYIHSKLEISIECPIHGEFQQKPNTHLNGYGCKRCSNQISNPQRSLFEFIESIDSLTILEDCLTFKPLQLDISIPHKNLAFELNGNWFHSLNHGGRYKDHLYNKYIQAKQIGVDVINIYEHEWKTKKNQCKNLVYDILNTKIDIPFDDCNIWMTDDQNDNWNTHILPFFNKYNIDELPNISNKTAICLTHNNRILKIIAFTNIDEFDLEIIGISNHSQFKIENCLIPIFKNYLSEQVKIVYLTINNRFYTEDLFLNQGFLNNGSVQYDTFIFKGLEIPDCGYTKLKYVRY